jgi:hypothetical protein
MKRHLFSEARRHIGAATSALIVLGLAGLLMWGVLHGRGQATADAPHEQLAKSEPASQVSQNGAVAPANEYAPITLDPKAISAGEIRTAPVRQLDHAPPITAYGTVLDPQPLATLSAQLAAARSKLAAEQAKAVLAKSEAKRATDLYGAGRNISEAALQTAQSKLLVAEADQAMATAQLAELQAHIQADWGTTLAKAAAAPSEPLPQLESGAQRLVEVSLPLGQALPVPPTDADATTPDGKRVALQFVSRAPRAVAGVAGQSLFYLMAGHSSAPIGTPLTVALNATAAKTGLLVPRSAVVWHNGEALAYRQTGPGSFLPVPVGTSFSSDEGYFVPQDGAVALHPGDRIVVDGAALLFSASQSPPPAAKAAKSDDDDD